MSVLSRMSASWHGAAKRPAMECDMRRSSPRYQESSRPATPASLRSWPPFADLPEAELEVLAAASHLRALPPRTGLCAQGEMPEHLHVLLRGRVCLTGAASDGQDVVVDFREAGECFVLAAAMADAPYLMTARTIAPSEVLFVEAEALRARARTCPRLGADLAAVLATEFRRLVVQIHDLKQRTAVERLSAYLVELAGGGARGPCDAAAGMRLRLPVEKRLLATKLGTRPESLSRAFAQLRPAGVRTEGLVVVIEDLERLKSWCGGAA